MADSIRAFIAVEIPAPAALRTVIPQLEQMGRAVRVVSTDGMHVTLKFLGDINPAAVPPIAQALKAAVQGTSAFEARMVGLGAFPHADRPSVVWVGFEDAEPLVAIAERLEKGLRPLGFRRERREFQPHVTLARVRSKPPAELAELLNELASTPFGVVAIDSVKLIRSELRPEGSLYTELESVPLSDARGDKSRSTDPQSS